MYLVNLNEREIGVELKEMARGTWRAQTHDGREVELALKGRDSDGLFLLTIDGIDRRIKLDAGAPDDPIVIDDGTGPIQLQVTSAADVVLEDLGKKTPTIAAENDLKSPITGIVLETRVKAGDHVEDGDPLVVVEAMKMENALGAPRSGRVAEVVVEPGKTVFVGDVLVRLEPK